MNGLLHIAYSMFRNNEIHVSTYMTSEKAFTDRPPIQVQEAQLREFIATGAVTRIVAAGKADGFELHVHIGAAIGVLGNARGITRTFTTLNTLAGLVKRLGADHFEVAIGDFSTESSIAIKRTKK